MESAIITRKPNLRKVKGVKMVKKDVRYVIFSCAMMDCVVHVVICN